MICAIEHVRKKYVRDDDDEKLQASIRGVEKKPLPQRAVPAVNAEVLKLYCQLATSSTDRAERAGRQGH